MSKVYRQETGMVRTMGNHRLVTHPGLGATVQRVQAHPGQIYPGVPQQVMRPYPAAMVRQDQGASLGAQDPTVQNALTDPTFKDFNKIPTNYIISIVLGGSSGNNQAGSVSLRPEPFVMTRMTWATTGDTPPYIDTEPGYSLQGRAVRMSWGDEFTKLFGTQSCLVAAALGDANGFLDQVKGLLFQGSQTLTLYLNRLHWPAETDEQDTQWDFCFSGLSLLPPGVNQSGSAG